MSVTLSEVLLFAPELIVILVEERYGEQRVVKVLDGNVLILRNFLEGGTDLD